MGPAGAGKTTAIVGYLEARGTPFTWYDLDAGDADPATLFDYLALTVREPKARATPALPRFTLEYRAGWNVFARRFFEALFARLPAGAALVLDNYQELPAETPTHEIVREAIAVLPTGARLVV